MRTVATSISDNDTKSNGRGSNKGEIRFFSCDAVGHIAHCRIQNKNHPYNKFRQEKIQQRLPTARKLLWADKKTGQERQHSTNERKGGYMLVDSGALGHVLAVIIVFHSLTDVEKEEVELANGNTVKSRHRGKVLFDIGIMTLVLQTV